jgi:solute carrier family 41
MQHWDLFERITEMFILCPALLGLKGNLEMTFASRLSTASHLGRLADPAIRTPLILGNLLLIQCQAIVVAVAASLLSIIMGILVHHEFSLHDSLVIIASSLATASIASFLLGGIMALVVVCSGHCQVDPDNIATPIAAALGDLVTLAILAATGSLLLTFGKATVSATGVAAIEGR